MMPAVERAMDRIFHPADHDRMPRPRRCGRGSRRNPFACLRRGLLACGAGPRRANERRSICARDRHARQDSPTSARPRTRTTRSGMCLGHRVSNNYSPRATVNAEDRARVSTRQVQDPLFETALRSRKSRSVTILSSREAFPNVDFYRIILSAIGFPTTMCTARLVAGPRVVAQWN